MIAFLLGMVAGVTYTLLVVWIVRGLRNPEAEAVVAEAGRIAREAS